MHCLHIDVYITVGEEDILTHVTVLFLCTVISSVKLLQRHFFSVRPSNVFKRSEAVATLTRRGAVSQYKGSLAIVQYIG